MALPGCLIVILSLSPSPSLLSSNTMLLPCFVTCVCWLLSSTDFERNLLLSLGRSQ